MIQSTAIPLTVPALQEHLILPAGDYPANWYQHTAKGWLTKINCWGIFLFKYNLEQKYYAPQVWPNWGSNSWPPDHDSAFQITKMPPLTTQPSVTSDILHSVIFLLKVPLLCITYHMHYNADILWHPLLNNMYIYIHPLKKNPNILHTENCFAPSKTLVLKLQITPYIL